MFISGKNIQPINYSKTYKVDSFGIMEFVISTHALKVENSLFSSSARITYPRRQGWKEPWVDELGNAQYETRTLGGVRGAPY